MEELVRRRDEEDLPTPTDQTRSAPAEPVIPEPVLAPRVLPPLSVERLLEHSLTPGEVSSAPLEEAPAPLAAFEELEVIGTGGTGVVTKARRRDTGEVVAIKRLRREADSLSQRFLREAEAIASLDHPHIVRLHEVVLGVSDEAIPLALVLELVDGPDAERLVRREGRLPIQQALQIGWEVAQALAHAHARGVIHRDVKPGNVLIDADGKAKLVDFGLALPLETQLSLTETGQALGTVDTMAPEQWSPGARIDARTDVYGLGATLYRLLTGASPRVIRERRLPEVARELVLRCVEEDPADRFATMTALADELAAALAAVQEDSSGVHAPLERISRQLRHDLDTSRTRSNARRLEVAAAGLTALGLLEPDAPRRLRVRLELGEPLGEEVRLVVEHVLERARPRGRERPRLLADANAVLSAALAGAELDATASGALRRLGEASRIPVREDPSARLVTVVSSLVRRGALRPRDLTWLATTSGNAVAVLEGILGRLRNQCDPLMSPAEERAQLARWRHGLQALDAALPEPHLSRRIHEELLAVHLRVLALDAAEQEDEEDEDAS